MSRRHKKILINLSISVASIILVLLALEISLRAGMLGTGEVTWIETCKGDGNIDRYHSSYGWTWSPNSQYIIQGTELEDWDRRTINNEGFRGTYDKGNRTAIILGDSHTFGSLVDDHSTFSYLLDYWSENMSFRNYGMMGYGTAQQLEVYKNVSENIEHDLVILTYYLGNDAQDNVRKNAYSGKRPLYKLQNGSLELKYQPERKKSLLKSTYFNTPLRHFVFPKYLYRKFMNARNYFDSKGPGNRSEPSIGRRLNLTKALVEKIGEISKGNDAELLIAILPTKGEARCSRYPDICRSDREGWDQQRRMLENVGERRENVRLLDLLEPLKKNNETYGTIDAHISERGHRTVAQALHKRLVREGFVKGENEQNIPEEASRCSSG